jgi:hypothetical protein
MVKRKFGASVRAKTFPAQVNETLLKCLCHNLLVHAIHELRIDPFGPDDLQPPAVQRMDRHAHRDPVTRLSRDPRSLMR